MEYLSHKNRIFSQSIYKHTTAAGTYGDATCQNQALLAILGF